MKILIVDDHPVARRGMQALISDAFGGAQVIPAANGRQALEHAAQSPPDLVVLDLRIPGDSAPTNCRGLLERAPRARIVILTAFDDSEELRLCLAAGAHGCLLKDTAEANVERVLKRIMAGETIIDSRIANRLALEYSLALRSDAKRLTTRERDVLKLLAEGLSNRAISGKMFLAESTVKGHVAALRKKLGATSRLHAVIEADRLGLL